MMRVVLSHTGLPIEAHVDQLASALGEHRHAVLQAEPGAGKTTVVPLRLLEASWLGGDRIVVLEPRRVATRAAARRMAALLGEEPGETVGWVTRDDRCVGPGTRVEVVTEGVLTRRMLDAPDLPGVGVIVFDEFHERSLPGDTGLALALHGRDHLGLTARLLVMSATIDTAAVAALLGGDDREPAPVIEAPGRAHPVEVRWRPRKRRDRLVSVTADAVEEALRLGGGALGGDVLVFLPGMGEIIGLERELRSRLGADGPAVLPLHGSLSAAEQDAALVPRATRRIVLATDLAETSVTVDGISVVVDSGVAREPRFDVGTAMTRLATVDISKASAEQRAGRAGRQRPGTVIRLWSKYEHAARAPFRPPAVTQVDLGGLVLDLAERGLTDPTTLGWLDPPPAGAWDRGVAELVALGALDATGHPTELGLAMARLPLEPRLARIVAAGRHRWLGCLLAAVLEDRDVLRGRPKDLPDGLDERVALLVDPGLDHPALDGRAVRRARDRAHDLARRAGIEPGPVELADIGAALAPGFRDRVARARQRTTDRFALADGRSVQTRRDSSLLGARGIVAVDLGIRPKNPIVARGARLEARVDHLVYATPDLAATVAEIRDEWGVEPTVGGSHPGRGTANVLLALGDHAYLEVIGPDPDQPAPPADRAFGIDALDEPRLVTWAAGVPDLDLWIEWARARGLDPGDAFEMSRTRPDGRTIAWRLTPPPERGDGVVPFLIEWPDDSPAADAAGGCTLADFVLHHDDPAIAGHLAEHAIPIDVAAGPSSLQATLFAPNGIIDLRS